MSELVTNDKQAMNALKQHGNKIITAVALVLAVFFGWQYYQNNFAKIDTVAADMYTMVSNQNNEIALAAQNPDPSIATALAEARTQMYKNIDDLVTGHPDTVYAWQALMIKARNQADSGDTDGAITSLDTASKITIEDEGLLAISRLQHARLLLDKGDTEAALDMAQSPMPQSFEPSRQEVLGDIYVAKNEPDNAKNAYNQAWQILSERHEDRALLSLKMQALGMMVSPIEPKHQVVIADSEAAVSVAESMALDTASMVNDSDNQATQEAAGDTSH